MQTQGYGSILSIGGTSIQFDPSKIQGANQLYSLYGLRAGANVNVGPSRHGPFQCGVSSFCEMIFQCDDFFLNARE